MLQKLAGDVQAQVGGIHDAPDKAEVLGDEVRALVHDHDAARIELQAGLVFAGVVVVRGFRGDEQHSAVARQALGVHPDDAHGVGAVPEMLLVVRLAVLVRDLALGPLPDGDHRVHDLVLHDGVVRALAVLAAVFVPLPALHVHVDGPADVVGVFPDELLELPALQVIGIALLVGVLLDVHDDVRADGLLLAGGDGVPVRAGGLPAVRLLRAEGAGHDGHGIRHHERGVEAHAELADDVHVPGVFRALDGLPELVRAARRDDAEVCLQLVLRHADAVVGHGEGPGVLVHVDADAEVLPGHAHGLVRQALIAELVDGVGGVRYDLTQEDLLVRVDGVYHHVQEPPGLRLELFLCHEISSFR